MYELKQGTEGEADYTFYGGVREFVRYKGPEAIIHGPAETGKTLGALYKLHICACKYPGASLVITRKTLSSTYSTVLQTFKAKVLGLDESLWPCEAYGGEKPEWFNYDNGSRIWIAGMDKASKILSAEHDIIYVNQAEEFELDDWETLTTRTTGRAGNMPYSQTIGDCNPAWPAHWLYSREPLRIFYSKHTENPALYDQETGAITEQGERTMAILRALTGVRRARLLEGRPDQPEGMIYDVWDDKLHLKYAAAVPKFRRYVAGQDWGYTHPGVLGVWGLDWDDRMFLVAQIYRTKENIDWWTQRAVELNEEFGIEAFSCDPSEPAYIEQYKAAGLNAVAAYSRVLPGIDAVQRRLNIADDGSPRLFIMRDSLRYVDEALRAEKKPHKAEDEFMGYVWASAKTKEQPVKQNDDGMDMIRYSVAYIDRIGEPKKKVVRAWV